MHEQIKNSVDCLKTYAASSKLRNAKITLASGLTIKNPVELIKRFYTNDGHVLYDLLPVPEDDILDPACLIAPAFFLTFNPRFDEWRELWERRRLLEDPLRRIPCGLTLASDSIPWVPIKDIFGKFLVLKGFRLSRTSKVLHKKRPHLIPILDERIIKYHYPSLLDHWLKKVHHGPSPPEAGHSSFASAASALKSEDFAVTLIEAIRNDLLFNVEVLQEIQSGLNPCLKLSLVRIFDLVLWQNAGASGRL